MICRLAELSDLLIIQAMFAEIIEHMNQQQIQIWDAVYPNEFFCEDIQKQRLYLLEAENAIAAVFALCDTNLGEQQVRWHDEHASALYLDRLGVNVHYSKRGIGSMALSYAQKLALEKGADTLRLFVVDINQPAISLYLKNGFTQAQGHFEEWIDEDLCYHELGFEKQLHP